MKYPDAPLPKSAHYTKDVLSYKKEAANVSKLQCSAIKPPPPE
jgi:hypothetical protein